MQNKRTILSLKLDWLMPQIYKTAFEISDRYLPLCYMNILDLSGKTVVITGAGSGAGRAAAVEFAQQGANIIIASRNEDALQEVKAECEE